MDGSQTVPIRQPLPPTQQPGGVCCLSPCSDHLADAEGFSDSEETPRSLALQDNRENELTAAVELKVALPEGTVELTNALAEERLQDNLKVFQSLAELEADECAAVEAVERLFNTDECGAMVRAGERLLGIVEGEEAKLLLHLPRAVARKSLALACAAARPQLLECEQLKAKVKDLHMHQRESSRTYLQELSAMRSKIRSLDSHKLTFARSEQYYWDALEVLPVDIRELAVDVIAEKLKCFMSQSEAATIAELQLALRRSKQRFAELDEEVTTLRHNLVNAERSKAEFDKRLSWEQVRTKALQKEMYGYEVEIFRCQKQEEKLKAELAASDIDQKELTALAKVVSFVEATDPQTIAPGVLSETLPGLLNKLDDDLDATNVGGSSLRGHDTHSGVRTVCDWIRGIAGKVSDDYRAMVINRDHEAARRLAAERALEELQASADELHMRRNGSEAFQDLHAAHEALRQEHTAILASLEEVRRTAHNRERESRAERDQLEVNNESASQLHPARVAELRSELLRQRHECQAALNMNDTLRESMEKLRLRLEKLGQRCTGRVEAEVKYIVSSCNRNVYSRLYEDALRRHEESYIALDETTVAALPSQWAGGPSPGEDIGLDLARFSLDAFARCASSSSARRASSAPCCQLSELADVTETFQRNVRDLNETRAETLFNEPLRLCQVRQTELPRRVPTLSNIPATVPSTCHMTSNDGVKQTGFPPRPCSPPADIVEEKSLTASSRSPPRDAAFVTMKLKRELPMLPVPCRLQRAAARILGEEQDRIAYSVKRHVSPISQQSTASGECWSSSLLSRASPVSFASKSPSPPDSVSGSRPQSARTNRPSSARVARTCESYCRGASCATRAESLAAVSRRRLRPASAPLSSGPSLVASPVAVNSASRDGVACGSADAVHAGAGHIYDPANASVDIAGAAKGQEALQLASLPARTTAAECIPPPLQSPSPSRKRSTWSASSARSQRPSSAGVGPAAGGHAGKRPQSARAKAVGGKVSS